METFNKLNFTKIANAFLDKLQYVEALKFANLAIDKNPYDVEALEIRALIFLQLLEVEKTILDLNKIITINDKYHLAYDHLGGIALQKGFYSEAETHFEKAVEIFPDNYGYLQSLIYVKLKLKKTEDCLFVCNELLKYNPSNKVALEHIGAVYLARKQFNEALKYYLKLQNVDEQNLMVYSNIGYIYGKLGDIKNAYAYLNHVKNIDANFIFLDSNLAYLSYLENNFENALDLINRAIKIDPSNSYAYKNRALIYLKQNKIEKAKEDLNIALELGFTNDYGQEVEELLLHFEDEDIGT